MNRLLKGDGDVFSAEFGMILFYTLSSHWFYLRVPKAKWNSSNGVEEKETWVEEDELFQVQGKPEGSHWSLSLTLAEVQMHATVNNVPETACLQNRKKFKSSTQWFMSNHFMSFPIKEWRLSKQHFTVKIPGLV